MRTAYLITPFLKQLNNNRRALLGPKALEELKKKLGAHEGTLGDGRTKTCETCDGLGVTSGFTGHALCNDCEGYGSIKPQAA